MRSLSASHFKAFLAPLIVATVLSTAQVAHAEPISILAAILGGWVADKILDAGVDAIIGAPDRWELQERIRAIETTQSFERDEKRRLLARLESSSLTYRDLRGDLQTAISRLNEHERRLDDLQQRTGSLENSRAAHARRLANIELRLPPESQETAAKHASSAFRAFEQGRFKESLDFFNLAIFYYPHSAKYHQGRSYALRKLGRGAEADEAWNNSIACQEKSKRESEAALLPAQPHVRSDASAPKRDLGDERGRLSATPSARGSRSASAFPNSSRRRVAVGATYLPR